VTGAIGFTGSRDLPAQAWPELRRRLNRLRADEYVTGACAGVDAFVGDHLVGVHPDAVHRVIVPANRSLVVAWWRRWPDAVESQGLRVFEMPPGTTYADRNRAIVTCSTRLIAIPAHDEDAPGSRRSGTWQTVRMARRKGIEVQVWMIDDLVAAGVPS
jgi:hypothetical protein